MSAYYAFNTKTTIAPAIGNEYATPADNTMLVLRKVAEWGSHRAASAPICLTGSGHGYDVVVGQRIRLVADQSGREMGTYVIEAIVEADTTVGTLPTRKVKHYVMK